MLPKVAAPVDLPPLKPAPRQPKVPKYRSVFADTMSRAWDTPLSQVAQVSGPVSQERKGQLLPRALRWREDAWKAVAVPKGVKGPHGEREYYWNVYTQETRWEPPEMIRNPRVSSTAMARDVPQDGQCKSAMSQPCVIPNVGREEEPSEPQKLTRPVKARDPVVFHTGRCLGGEYFHINASQATDTLKIEALDLDNPAISHCFSISMSRLLELIGKDLPIEAQCRWVVERLRFNDCRDLAACPKLVLEPLPIDLPRRIAVEGLPDLAVGNYVLEEMYLAEHEPLRFLVWEKEDDPSLRLFKALQEEESDWSWGCSSDLPFHALYRHADGDSTIPWALPSAGSWVSCQGDQETWHVKIEVIQGIAQRSSSPPLPSAREGGDAPPCPTGDAPPLSPDYNAIALEDPVWQKAREEEEEMLRQQEESQKQQKEQELAQAKAEEEEDKIAKEEAEKKAKDDADRIEKEEAEKKAKEWWEEAEKKAKEEADTKAKEEADNIAKESAKKPEYRAQTTVQQAELLNVTLSHILEKNIAFVPQKAELEPAGREVIQEIAAALKTYPKQAIILEGHARGKQNENDEFRMGLSEARSVICKKTLKEMGVTNDISTAGYGSKHGLGMCVKMRTVTKCSLRVRVTGAANLTKVNMTGKMDPYCVVKLDEEKSARGPTHKGGHQNPVWNGFEANLEWAEEPLHIQVWNNGKLIGVATCNLSEVTGNGYAGELDLFKDRSATSKKAGSVTVDISFPK